MQCGCGMPYDCMATLARILMDLLRGTGLGFRLLPVRRDKAVFDLYGVICCMDAHIFAEKHLANLHVGDEELRKAHQVVIRESEMQNASIRRFLQKNNITDELIKRIRGKQLALCLLHRQEKKVHKVFHAGLICEADVEELLEGQKKDYLQISKLRDHWRTEPNSDQKLVNCELATRTTRTTAGNHRLNVYARIKGVSATSKGRSST